MIQTFGKGMNTNNNSSSSSGKVFIFYIKYISKVTNCVIEEKK